MANVLAAFDWVVANWAKITSVVTFLKSILDATKADPVVTGNGARMMAHLSGKPDA